MRSKAVSLAVVTLCWCVTVPVAYAQRGMGDPTGVAQQATKPELVSLTGKIVSVETGPCEKTTGRGRAGTHMILQTKKQKEVNVHLGLAIAVEDIAKQLNVGKKVKVTAFRTEKMPEAHYVAQALKFDGKTVELRDENLRPFWAGGGQRGYGRGWGRGWGAGRGGGYGRR